MVSRPCWRSRPMIPLHCVGASRPCRHCWRAARSGPTISSSRRPTRTLRWRQVWVPRKRRSSSWHSACSVRGRHASRCSSRASALPSVSASCVIGCARSIAPSVPGSGSAPPGTAPSMRCAKRRHWHRATAGSRRRQRACCPPAGPVSMTTCDRTGCRPQVPACKRGRPWRRRPQDCPMRVPAWPSAGWRSAANGWVAVMWNLPPRPWSRWRRLQPDLAELAAFEDRLRHAGGHID